MISEAEAELAVARAHTHAMDVINATGAVWLMRDAVDEPELPPRPIPFRFTIEPKP